MRLIDADALKKKFPINDMCDYEEFCEFIDNESTVTIKEWKKEMPDYIQRTMLDTLRPQGEWIYDNKLNNWKCSVCLETPKTIGFVGNRDFMNEHFKYCNHCGAKMQK